MRALELIARAWTLCHDEGTALAGRFLSCGLYDGRNLESFQRSRGALEVLLVIPPMSDVNGPLPHPGVEILKVVLRKRGISTEVINYNLPVINPGDPFEHLIRAVRTLGVRIVGVSTYSQAIFRTLDALRRLKEACPDVAIIMGGPHPTESYMSLMGLRFLDYVVRGEAEESFPLLASALLSGRPPAAGAIPGVYALNRESGKIEGVPARFVDVEKLDEEGLLRYHFSPEELRQQFFYRGAHGIAGADYWPVALVRGCPYDCSFCAAYQMSGKKLRYRRVERVVDDLEFYVRAYGRRAFSFIDDAFTEQYEYVVELCREILRRKLRITFTTDNGIRYETLGRGKRLSAYLTREGLATVDDLIRLMLRAGWRGTAIGVESGAPRVRKDLVRKGGAQLTNDEILANLANLKRCAKEEGVYFYVNAFLMAGFASLPLRNGRVVPRETHEEMQMTCEFSIRLRDAGAVDLMNLSVVIPLPATDAWDSMTIEEKVAIITRSLPAGLQETRAVEEIRQNIVRRYEGSEEQTRYAPEAEAAFWEEVYGLSDEIQLHLMRSYDNFNADASHLLAMDRVSPQELWDFRNRVVDEFYGGMAPKFRMLKHVFLRSRDPIDFAAYLTLLMRKYSPSTKIR